MNAMTGNTSVERTDPYEYVLSANLHRRHLTAEQKREIIAKLLKAQPEKSNRTIASQDQCRSQDGRRCPERAEHQVGKFPSSTNGRADGKGRQQPTHKKAKQQEKAERRADARGRARRQDHRAAGQEIRRDLCRPAVAVRAVFARHRHGSRRRQPLSDEHDR